VGDGEHGFAVPVGVGGVDIAFDHLVVHQAINDISGFAFSGADDRGMEMEVAFVNERVGTHATPVPKVLERVIGVERIHRDLELLAVAGGVETIVGAIEFG
jgi:hypothetical protein